MKTSRSNAIAAGEKYYYTGKPCKHGHYSTRLTVDSRCLECNREYNRNERAKIREAQVKAAMA